MQNYQLTILISNKLDEKARQGVLDVVNSDLGEKAKAELWGVRGLAYPIKHDEKAFYAHYNFTTEPAAIPVIDRKLKLNEDIIRYLLIKVEEKKQKVNKDMKKPAVVEVKETKGEEKAEITESEESTEEKA